MGDVCYDCQKELKWYSAKADLNHLHSKGAGVPAGMSSSDKLCYDCWEKIDPKKIQEQELQQKAKSLIQVKQDEKIDFLECYKEIENFTGRTISMIPDYLKKELDLLYYEKYKEIAINCMTKFSKFWGDYSIYMECPNITVDFKKYNNYILDTCEEYEEHDCSKNDQVWLVLVTTIFAMNEIVTRANGEVDSNIHTIDYEKRILSRYERFLKKFKLPPRSIKPTKSRKSKPSVASVTKKEMDKNFEDYTWLDMENMVGELFEKKGYEVTVTQATGDFGIDVEARNDKESIGIQVKHWNNDVGYEDVAKTLGSSMGKFNRSIIVNSKSGFTSQAWQKQSEMPYVLELWDSTKLKSEIKKAFFNSSSEKIGKFCTQCGVKNIDKAKFCHECGESLNIVNDQA
jgi:HJR/Mrr/RecB family endonuclease